MFKEGIDTICASRYRDIKLVKLKPSDPEGSPNTNSPYKGVCEFPYDVAVPNYQNKQKHWPRKPGDHPDCLSRDTSRRGLTRYMLSRTGTEHIAALEHQN